MHVGGTADEVAAAEARSPRGRHPERPFVLVAQQSLVDPTRAPAGKHTLWAYCHVPNGSTVDMTDAIERQIERFAPGFRDLVLARHVAAPAWLEAHNAELRRRRHRRRFERRAAGGHPPPPDTPPYATSDPHLWLCSGSTPPGPGVHGMCGYHAARAVLRHSDTAG